jgi:DMSO/TMAO reductase YedYZ molybdopterin-dependent catalytic subunit
VSPLIQPVSRLVKPVSRRRFVSLAARSAGAAGLALAGCDGRRPQEGLLGAMERVNERLQRALFDPRRLAPELPERDATPEAEFPQYKIGFFFPDVPKGWRLEVGGMVARPLSLSLQDLRSLPQARMRVRHHCVEGWTAVAQWEGPRVAELARLAGADPSARYVEFDSFEEDPKSGESDADEPDGDNEPETYSSTWDLESALHRQTIVAIGMNGHPLPPDHGAPARLYTSVKLGYKMVKWLDRVTFTPERSGGYWEDQGYEWYAGV